MTAIETINYMESLPMIFTKLIKLKNVYTENYPACAFLIALRTSWFSS